MPINPERSWAINSAHLKATVFVSSYKSEDHSPLKVFDKDYNTEWISEGSGSINLLFPSKQSIKTVRLFFNGYSRREFDNICVILKVCFLKN